MKKVKPLLIFVSLITLSRCIIDIPHPRPDGPSIIIIGKVINDDTGTPVSDAVISDGFSTVLTDTNGEYRLKTYPGASHVFISVPELYEIPMNDGMPQIFQTIDTSKDSVQVNFSLTPLKNGLEKDFTLIAVADPQVRNANHLRRLNNETIPDIKNLVSEHNNVYGLTLGDLASDSLEYFGDIKESFISTNIPFFHTIGNHDFSFNIYDPINAAEEYISHFGPLNYSFNRGDAHIIILNNVYNYGVPTYNWGFSKEQINWLKSDLSHVPKNKMLIVSVHIPVFPTATMKRKSEFLELLSGFNEVHILSGHWHANQNYLKSDLNIYEHITGAASGMWWSSIVNKCGAPNGYGVYEISGNKMKNWFYKSVNFNKDFQINMLAPYTFGDKDGYVVANVWNADENWKIEMIEDGANRGQMEQFTDFAPEVFAYNKSLNIAESTNWYQKTNHLFRMKPNNPDAEITIKATDHFGNIYKQNLPLMGVNTLRKY
jgi:hypothetical protein